MFSQNVVPLSTSRYILEQAPFFYCYRPFREHIPTPRKSHMGGYVFRSPVIHLPPSPYVRYPHLRYPQ